MRRVLLLYICAAAFLLPVTAKSPHDADVDDNDFAEFEDFEDEDVVIMDEQSADQTGAHPDGKSQQSQDATVGDDEEEEDDEASVETEDEDEFEHFEDEEEFEGFDKDKPSVKGKSQDAPDLKIAKVPLHLRTNWDSFYVEMLMLAGLGVYFLNFLAGKTKNNKLAQAWLSAHKQMLEDNFSIVGDDGTGKEAQSGVLMKESENIYALWCSGRTCVEGMLVELKFLKRQDLIGVMSSIFKPASDQILITVDMERSVMESFVFAIALKKSATKLQKEVNDLNQFTEKKNLDKYFDIPNSYQVLSEIGEATGSVLDKKVCQVLNKFEGLVEYMHFSDQYSGARSQDEGQPTKMPETKPVLMFCFNVAGKGKSKPSDMEAMKPLLQLVFHCIDKVSRLQLSREAKLKADKNRQKAQEAFLKAAHTQRQEAAQARREQKHREEKERMMNEEDPEKTRKWEEKESRREMKRKQPKMKMMKVKAM